MSDEKTELRTLIDEDPSSFFYEGYDDKGWELVDEKTGDQRRWSQLHTHIFKSPTERYWKLTCDVGLTEYQDNGPVRIVGEVSLTETTRTIVEKTWTAIPTEGLNP